MLSRDPACGLVLGSKVALLVNPRWTPVRQQPLEGVMRGSAYTCGDSAPLLPRTQGQEPREQGGEKGAYVSPGGLENC